MEKMLMGIDEIPSKEFSWARAELISSTGLNSEDVICDADYELDSSDDEKPIFNEIETRNLKYTKHNHFHLFD